MSEEIYSQKKVGKESTYLPFFLLFMGIFAASWGPIFVQLSEREISPLSTAFFREAIPSICLGFWLSLSDRSAFGFEQKSSQSEFKNLGKLKILLIIASISASLSYVAITYSLTKTSIANSAILQNLKPLFATLGGWAIFGQSFSYQFLIGMVIAIGGAIGISIEDLWISYNNLEGDLLGLGGAVLYTIYLLIVEKLRSTFQTKTILFWRCTTGTLLLFPLLLISRDSIFPLSLNGWLSIFALALLSQIIGQGLVTYSLKKLSSRVVALSFLLMPIFSTILAWFLFSERLSLSNFVFFLTILFGLYLAISDQESEDR